MKILLPSSLTLNDSLLFNIIVENTSNEREYEFDFRNLGTVEPFGMLIVSAKLRQFRIKHTDSRRMAIGYEKATYAGHMGFFKSFGLDFGNEPGEALGSSTYIPITKLNVCELKEEARLKIEPVGETIEKKAENMARILTREEGDLSEHLTYSIREIMRNIVEHSEADSIWLAGQYWPSKDLVEVSILDEGIGITSSLKGNPHLKITNDEDSLLLAIEPGISGKAFGKRININDVWANTGYGLYMTSSICQNGGNFVICSKERALIFNNEGYKFIPTIFDGTAIRLRIRVSTIGKLSKLLSQLVFEGEKKAKENLNNNAILTASKVSRVLTTKQY